MPNAADDSLGGLGLIFNCRKCRAQITATTRTPADAVLPCCGATMAEGCPALTGVGEWRNYAMKFGPVVRGGGS